jgi:ABC-type dipeptide/oligopeptide/nickel transport system ATPase component
MTSLNPLHTIETQIGEILQLHSGIRGPMARSRTHVWGYHSRFAGSLERASGAAMAQGEPLGRFGFGRIPETGRRKD